MHRDEVFLYPQPDMVRVANPGKHLSKLQPVDMVANNLLELNILGHDIIAYVDNGCTSCFVRFETAQQLGIMRYVVCEQRVNLVMWSCARTFHMYMVNNLPVKIKGGPLFKLRCKVFRKGEMPKHFLDFMLDNGTLRHLRVVQVFHPKGSTLYFPHMNYKKLKPRDDQNI